MAWVDRQRNILDFTLSSLLRRRGKNLSLITIYALVVFLSSSILMFSGSMKSEARKTLKGSPDLLIQRMDAGRHTPVPGAYLNDMLSIRGVSSGEGRLWGYYFDPKTGANYTVMAQVSGITSGKIKIGSGVSKASGLEKNGIITLRAMDGTNIQYRVSEVFDEDSALLTSDLMLMTTEDFKSFFGSQDGYFTDISLTVKNKLEVSTIARKITDMHPDVRPITNDEILRTYDAVFNYRAGMMGTVLLLCVLAFAILAWDRASGLSEEEKSEIGILKAVGWETSDVLVMKLQEGAVISVSSFLIGSLAAYTHVYLFGAYLIRQAIMGWSVIYPEFRLAPDIGLLEAATLFFLTVAPYTSSTIIPSWRASVEDPDSIMRK